MENETHKFGNGFTMVEVVVMLAIITAISAIVLTSFTGINESSAINRSARELALSIRRAQNMSLAVTQIEVGSPPTFQIPPGVGARVSTSESDRHYLFADLSPSDFKYTSASEKIGGTEVIFERRIRINRIVGETEHSAVHIIFTAPEAAAFITDGNGSAISGDKVDIELISPSGQLKRTVSVRTSGQITVK